MSTTIVEEKEVKTIEKTAQKEEGSKAISSDQERASFSVSPERQQRVYD